MDPLPISNESSPNKTTRIALGEISPNRGCNVASNESSSNKSVRIASEKSPTDGGGDTTGFPSLKIGDFRSDFNPMSIPYYDVGSAMDWTTGLTNWK